MVNCMQYVFRFLHVCRFLNPQQDDRGDMKRPSVVSIPLSGPADIPQTTTTIMKRSSVAERMLRLPRLGRLVLCTFCLSSMFD